MNVRVDRGRADRPRAFAGDDPAEDLGIRFRRDGEGVHAMRVLNRFQHLRRTPYWGNHFWIREYYPDTVGLDA